MEDGFKKLTPYGSHGRESHRLIHYMYAVLSATLTKFLPYRISSVTLKPNTPEIVSLPPPITVIYVAALHNVPEAAPKKIKYTKYA
jgi:hypothetical protein